MPKQSTVVEFPPNKPVTITLKTSPAEAKAKDYVSKAGKPYQKWTYFTTDGGVFWAFEALHKQLQKFASGDKVTLTNIVPIGAQYGTVMVDNNGKGSSQVQTPVTSDMAMMVKELVGSVRMLNQRFDALLHSLGHTSLPQNAPQETREKKDTSLDF